jgi:hypothetical protein
MKAPFVVTVAASAAALVVGLTLAPSPAAQMTEQRMASARQFLPIGASSSYAWFIDVHSQQAIACVMQGESSPQARITCRSAPIP